MDFTGVISHPTDRDYESLFITGSYKAHLVGIKIRTYTITLLIEMITYPT